MFLEYQNLSKKQEIKYNDILTNFGWIDTIKISKNYLNLLEVLENEYLYSNKRWRNVNIIYKYRNT